MRPGILVAVVLIIGLLAGFGGGYLLTPTVTTTKTLTSTTTSPITITTVSPTTIYKTETTTSKVLKTVTETETSLTTTTAYSTVTTTTTLEKEVPPMITVNATLELPLIVKWRTGEGMLNVSIKILSLKRHYGVETFCDINITNVGDKTIREALFLILPYIEGELMYSEKFILGKPYLIKDLKPGESKALQYEIGSEGDEPPSFKFAVLVLKVGAEA